MTKSYGHILHEKTSQLVTLKRNGDDYDLYRAPYNGLASQLVSRGLDRSVLRLRTLISFFESYIVFVLLPSRQKFLFDLSDREGGVCTIRRVEHPGFFLGTPEDTSAATVGTRVIARREDVRPSSIGLWALSVVRSHVYQ